MAWSNRDVPLLKEVDFTQASAVQNTWYTIADLTNVLFHACTYTVETNNETLEVRVTGDIAFTVSNQVVVAGTGYNAVLVTSWGGYCYITADANAQYLSLNNLPFRHFKIEIRKTTAAGANSDLRATLCYSQF